MLKSNKCKSLSVMPLSLKLPGTCRQVLLSALSFTFSEFFLSLIYHTLQHSYTSTYFISLTHTSYSNTAIHTSYINMFKEDDLIDLYSSSSVVGAVSSPASVASSLAPVASSLAPVASSLAPVVSSLAPVTFSTAPVTSSTAPVTSSTTPLTSAPVPVALPSASTAVRLRGKYPVQDFHGPFVDTNPACSHHHNFTPQKPGLWPCEGCGM